MTRAVGVDLGGTNARAALVHLESGQIIGDDVKVKVEDRRPEGVADIVAHIVNEVDPRGERCGVGVGFAGMLRGFTGVVVNAPNFGWREVDLRGLLRTRIDERVEIYNDLKAITFGEQQFGGARGFNEVLCVFVGTGLGAGIITCGRVTFGSSHLAGEIGHQKVVFGPTARLCGCGQRGCIEAYVGGRKIQERAREELGEGGQTSLAVELAGGLDKLHAGHLDEAAGRGDPYAVRLWDEIAGLLGPVLANLVTALNPERLIMGGGMWMHSPELQKRVTPIFEATVNPPSTAGFLVVPALLADNAGVLGSAALAARTLSSQT